MLAQRITATGILFKSKPKQGCWLSQHDVHIPTQIRLFLFREQIEDRSLYVSISGPGETRDNWGGYLSGDNGDTGHREGQETGCHKGEWEEEMVKTMMTLLVT